MIYQILTQPSVEPITLTEMKEYLSEDGNDRDTLISAFIQSARETVENYIGKGLMEQSWNVFLNDFPTCYNPFEFPINPVISITSVKYKDSEGAYQDVSDSNYITDLNTKNSVIQFIGTLPTLTDDQLNRIKIEFKVGYGASETAETNSVPSAIKLAIKCRVAELMTYREDRPISSQMSKVSIGFLESYKKNYM